METLLWLIATIAAAVVCGGTGYKIGRVAGKLEIGVTGYTTESPEFCGFLKTLPQTSMSGTRKRERWSDDTE